MATRKQIFWALGFGLACWMAAASLRADVFPLARRIATGAALTNTPILVTVTFTNASTNALRGFFYGEQVPSALTVSPLSLTINGGTITNYVVENGQDGDVYPGCTPWRWVLETPTNFTKPNPLPPQASVQITYSLSSPTSRSYALAEFDWAGFNPAGTNSFFGFSQTNDLQIVNIFASMTPPQLTGQRDTNGFTVSLNGLASSGYVIEASLDLLTWIPLVTNTAPFAYTDTNRAGQPPLRFYRSRIFLNGP